MEIKNFFRANHGSFERDEEWINLNNINYVKVKPEYDKWDKELQKKIEDQRKWILAFYHITIKYENGIKKEFILNPEEINEFCKAVTGESFLNKNLNEGK